MICKKCGNAKPFAEGAVICVHYGMIIREDHECTREGWKHESRDDGQRREGEDETEV